MKWAETHQMMKNCCCYIKLYQPSSKPESITTSTSPMVTELSAMFVPRITSTDMDLLWSGYGYHPKKWRPQHISNPTFTFPLGAFRKTCCCLSFGKVECNLIGRWSLQSSPKPALFPQNLPFIPFSLQIKELVATNKTIRKQFTNSIWINVNTHFLVQLFHVKLIFLTVFLSLTPSVFTVPGAAKPKSLRPTLPVPSVLPFGGSPTSQAKNTGWILHVQLTTVTTESEFRIICQFLFFWVLQQLEAEGKGTKASEGKCGNVKRGVVVTRLFHWA